MKECKNIKNKKYSGKENTPLGLGYHASGYEEGKRMKGKDKNYYKVKNGRWQKVLKSVKRNTRGIFDDPDVSEADKIRYIKSKEDFYKKNRLILDKTNDLCNYLIKALASNDYTPRGFLYKEMENVFDELNFNCSDKNKIELINRLTGQYSDSKSAKFGIRKILANVEIKK